MKWLPDPTRRFARYPYYEGSELDLECQALVSNFLQAAHRSISYPLSTADLCALIESLASDLDWNADLSHYGDDVEGITHFSMRGRPRVEISRHLSDSILANRFRMTLAHELAHVHFHNCLYQLPDAQMSFLAQTEDRHLHCKRESIAGKTRNDWMEWQAAYGGGAILMPFDAVKNVVGKVVGASVTAMHPDSDVAERTCSAICEEFQVSRLAATVRLEKLGVLSRATPLNI